VEGATVADIVDCVANLSVGEVLEPQTKKARKIRAFSGSGLRPFYFYCCCLRVSTAASIPMPPNQVLEIRITTNTVIGTIIAIKNPPQNSSPHRRNDKIRPESTQLTDTTQVSLPAVNGGGKTWQLPQVF
jgi:hypothetical protein